MSSPFDVEIDAYSEKYRVYWLPQDVDLSGSWHGLEERAVREMGSVPVALVRFASSRESAMDFDSIGVSMADLDRHFVMVDLPDGGE